MSKFWTVAWALSLSWAWILPNYNLPWIAFHKDAWLALNLLLAAFVLIARDDGPTPWYPLSIVTAALVLVPGFQWWLGMIAFEGTAWVSAAYLLGLLLSMLTGAKWARRNANELADSLFIAIGLAATLSVAIAVYQWLDMTGIGYWVLAPSEDRRAFANLAQPNQLGTFLIWGLLACTWTFSRGYIRGPVAILWALYLLTGIALTQSRTSWLVLAVLACSFWYWRKLWSVRHMAWIVSGLAAYFFAVNLVLEPLARNLYLGETMNLFHKSIESRPAIWRMMLDASLQHPWIGYGWNQVPLAQIAVAANHPGTRGMSVAHSHNLILDLALYMGWPIALLVTAAVLGWVGLQLKRIKVSGDLVLVLFVVSVGIHAMLELPLHYGYMLLPTGLVIGMLDIRNAVARARFSSKWHYAGICLAAAALLGGIIRDYLLVEANFQAYRFEKARIGTLAPRPTPQVWLLTQHREILRMGRTEFGRGMTQEQLDTMRKVTETYPSVSNLYLLALALGLNNHGEEAQTWLNKVCYIVPADHCAIAKHAWKDAQQTYPELAPINGPQ